MDDPVTDGGQRSYLEQHGISYAAFAVVCLLGIFALYQIGGGVLTYLSLGSLTVTPENVQRVRLVTMLSQLLFLLAPTLFCARLVASSWSQVVPLRMPRAAEWIVGIFSLLAVQRVVETLMFLQRQIPIPHVLRSVLGPLKEMVETMMRTLIAASSTGEFAFVFLVVAIVPAVVEELYFRGLLQHLFARAWNPAGAAVASGVLFGLFHINPFDAVGLIALGVFFGYMRWRSGSILLPVTLHFLNNALALVAANSGFDERETLVESIGQDPSLGLMLVQGAAFGLVLWGLLRSYHRMTAMAPETVP